MEAKQEERANGDSSRADVLVPSGRRWPIDVFAPAIKQT
jgi:hypothetical protein